MGDTEWAERFTAAGLDEWWVRQSQARTEVHCGSFAAAGELAARVARVCDEQDHHAELDVRAPDVLGITTWTRDAGGLTDRDLRLALAVHRLVTDGS